MILDDILAYKRKELAKQKARKSLKELSSLCFGLPPVRDFKKALKDKGISLIAEIKKASPSLGIIREDFDSVSIAKIYEEGGAKAISVLTERKFFQGSLALIKKIKKFTTIPILCKDFIIDPYQIYQSRLAEADALLLIAGVLEEDKISKFLELAHSLGMVCLVEVHTEEELSKVLKTKAEVIGINNRDLKTFKVDLKVTKDLFKKIPEGRIVVSESGISNYQQVRQLKDLGVDAVLVGETLLKGKDIGKKVRELSSWNEHR